MVMMAAAVSSQQCSLLNPQVTARNPFRLGSSCLATLPLVVQACIAGHSVYGRGLIRARPEESVDLLQARQQGIRAYGPLMAPLKRVAISLGAAVLASSPAVMPAAAADLILGEEVFSNNCGTVDAAVTIKHTS